MIKAGSGEFSIWNNKSKGGLAIYRAHGQFFKDVFKDNRCITPKSIEITKEEYTNKLKQYIRILESELK